MGLVNAVVPLADLERETVAWCREMRALSPLALRLLKASFNADRGRARRHPAALPRRDPALLHDRGGPGGPQRLPARAAQPDFSQVPEAALSLHADLADGGAAADAAGGDRAGAGRHRGRGRAAGDAVRVGAFVAALVGSIFIQIGTNLANDYSDAKRGADTADRLGPVRVTSAGLVAPRRVLIATWIAFGVAVACGHLPGDRRRAR